MSNISTISGFLLYEFSKIRELQMLYFFAFFMFYMAVVTANLLVISAIVSDHRLHTPMYLFLMNLAIQDLGAISVIVPKSMANMLMNTRHISYFGCASQVFFVISFLGSDFWILTVMAYDRYVAICNPLQYETIMNKQACIYMLFSVWVSGFLCGLLHTCFIFASPFCSNVVNQFFCEIPQLVKLSCTGLSSNEITLLVFLSSLAFGCFLFILISYVSIFSAVLKMPSMEGRKKAFTTCLPHLMVVSMFLFSGSFAYLRPPSSNMNLASTFMYSLLPPFLNPVIYSMRNRSIKLALLKLLYTCKHKTFFFSFASIT